MWESIVNTYQPKDRHESEGKRNSSMMGELSFINAAPFNNTNENRPRARLLDGWREAGEKQPKVSRACFRPRDLEMGADWPRAEPERGPLCGRTTGCDWPVYSLARCLRYRHSYMEH